MVTPDRDQLRRLALQRLQSLQNAGVQDLPRAKRTQQELERVAAALGYSQANPAASVEEPAMSSAAVSLPEPKEESVPGRSPANPPSKSARSKKPQSDRSADGPSDSQETAMSGPPLPREQRVAALATLCNSVAACTRCQELASTRTQTVFGVGDPMARLVLLGEAPGADEDRQGEPFVGRAGQLLTKILEACTLRREDVYILNILKCRPPGNRNPAPDESANCREYLQQQLSIIRPEFICCLGAVATQNLLETTTPIGQLRGKFHRFGDIRVLATYHPAYLLRNPNAKRATWDDMKLLMTEMGIDIPSR